MFPSVSLYRHPVCQAHIPRCSIWHFHTTVGDSPPPKRGRTGLSAGLIHVQSESERTGPLPRSASTESPAAVFSFLLQTTLASANPDHAILDMDVGNSLLVTCGMQFSNRAQQMVPDKFVKVYNLRYNSASQPIQVRWLLRNDFEFSSVFLPAWHYRLRACRCALPDRCPCLLPISTS